MVIGPVHRSEQLDPSERFSPEEACREIEAAGRAARTSEDYEQVFAAVREGVRAGDVVVALSNGPFGGVVTRLGEELRCR